MDNIKNTNQNTAANYKHRVLHLIDTTGPGGAETVFIQLADKLRERGHDSVVVIRGPGWVEQQLKSKGITPIIIPAEGSFAFRFLLDLVKVIRKKKITMLQSHLLGSNVYASIAGMVTKTPVVATYHGMVDIDPSERFKKLKKLVMRWGISSYVAVSKGLLENIKQQNLLEVKKTKVIYNGVDLERYKLAKSNELKASLNIPQESIIVGSLGNVRPAKGYSILIEAGALAIKNNKNIHFLIAGDKKKSLMTSLEKQITSLGCEKNFHFIGFCDSSSYFLSQLDVFVLSSLSEGFSIATIEAMASKLPVIVTRCGGPEEIVSPNSNALMVEPNNPKALANALTRLLTDKPLQTQLAKNARQTVEERFGIEKMILEYEKLYNQAVS